MGREFNLCCRSALLGREVLRRQLNQSGGRVIAWEVALVGDALACAVTPLLNRIDGIGGFARRFNIGHVIEERDSILLTGFHKYQFPVTCTLQSEGQASAVA